MKSNRGPNPLPREPPGYSAFGLMKLVEESALPSELKQLATTYIRAASSKPKDGHPAGYGYTGQARLAAAQGIKPRALRLRLTRFDALADAGASPIRIRRGFRARHGEGNRGGRGSDWYQIERVESYMPPDRSGSGVPDGSPTEAVVDCLIGPTEAVAECRLAPDRSGSPLPMICGAITCEGDGSAEPKETGGAVGGGTASAGPAPALEGAGLVLPPGWEPPQDADPAKVESFTAAFAHPGAAAFDTDTHGRKELVAVASAEVDWGRTFQRWRSRDAHPAVFARGRMFYVERPRHEAEPAA